MTDIDGLIAGLLSPEYGIADMPLIREAADALDGMRRENKTLRNTVHVQKGGYQNMLAAAQSEIATLTKERDKLFLDWQLERERADHNAEVAAAAEKQNAELREGLEDLLRYSWPDNGGPADLAIKDARSLLKEDRG